MAAIDAPSDNPIRKLVLLCVSLTVAINAPVFYVLAHHADELAEIRQQLIVKTADRYYRSDHLVYEAAHDKVVNLRFEAVTFRFLRNETQINYCKQEIAKLKEKG